MIFFYLPLLFSALIRETDKIYEKSYKSVGRVGYYFEYLGEVPRSPKPELKSEGYLPSNRYPTYNAQPSSLTEEEKSLIYQENYFLATKSSSKSGTFDILDKDGYLYYNNQLLTYENGTSRKLYRHLGSVNNYLGEVSDNEPAITKRISLKPRIRTYSTTGLYAPPGEVISLRISEKELQKVGSLKVSIGPIQNSGSCIEIESGKSIVRMPLSTMLFTINASLQPHERDGSDYIFYLGSFFGGPIFAFGTTFSTEEYTFTISGAVPHCNFILGFTTPEEYEYNDKSTAPFFVLDVYTKGISFIGPRSQTGPIDYHGLYEVADYWNKVSAVSNQYSPSPYSDESITMNHEPYIPAGAAVAIRGGAATQCPISWLPGPLLYKYNLMDSANWGSHHEYNHHFQNSWGFYGGSETTNNAITLAAYTFYSRNSQRRTETSDDSNTGWNDYNSATWVLKKALAETHENYFLDVYTVLLHCLGPDLFSLSARTAFTHGGDNNYYTAVWTNITHLDFTYYVETLYRQRYEINKTIVYQLTYGNKGYSNFIPIACRYQTGLGYMVNGKRNEIHTMRPFIIKNKVDKVINFTEQMVIPEKFAFTIKSFTNPEHGTLTKQDENVYVYHPDADHILSGKMTFLIGLTKVDDPNFLIDDIEMYIEFQQSSAYREKYNDEDILDLELYVYPDDIIPEDPIVEYNDGFSRSINKIEMLNNKSTTCFSSSGNTELVVSNNPDIPQRISVLRGKFEVQKGKFRIGLRARNRTALFLSYDGGKTYSPECKVFVECANEFFNTYESYPDFYVDKEFEQSQWIYFKIVMCHKMDVAGRRRFAEIGIGSIQEDGNVVVASIHNARGEDYQIDPDFYPDDVFPKLWSQAYAITSPLKGTILDRNYKQWGYQFNLENICDNDDSNGIKTWANFINDTNPFRVLIDLGSEISANAMTIFGIRDDDFQAKKFILYGGTDRNDLHIIANVDNAEVDDKNVLVKFELQNIRYYKLEVYDTYCNDGRVLLSFRYIQFSIQYQGRLVPIDNQTVTLYNGWETIHYPSANFGKIYKSISNIDKPSKALFKFNGTSFGINAYKSPDYGRFYVYVDGQKIGRIRLDEPISRVQCIYIVENLEDTEHEVLIEDISGLNLDSFIIFDDKYLPDEIFSVKELPPIKSDLNYAEDTQTPSPSPEFINPELPTSERTENYVSIIFECDIVSGNIVLNHDCSSDECSVKNNIWVKLTFEKGQITLTEYLEGTIIDKNSVTSNTQDLINNFEYNGKTKELKYKIESTFITLNEQQTENNLICIKPPTESPKPTESATQSPSPSLSPSPIATYSPEPIPDEIEFVQALGNYADDNYLNARLIATTSFTCTTSGDLVNYPINNAFSTNNNLFWVGHRPVTETFRPYIIFDFKQTFTLEALVYTSGYRSQAYSRIFDGFPFKLNIYASVNNGPFLLKYRFSGDAPTSKQWDKTLYEFQDRLVCDKLKIEFVNVTENDSFNLAKARHPSALRIMLLKYIPPSQTPLPTVTPIYAGISSDEIESIESSISSDDELIKTTENPTENMFETLEPPPTPDSSILSNLQGLINITCDKFEYTDWEIEGTQGAVCVKVPDARHGSYTENKGAKAAVTFIGTKVHLLGWKQKGSGTANIYIDNEMAGTADFDNDNDESKSDIVFTSRDLPYGEHVIEIEHNKEQENKLITFGGIYVDPLPKQGGFTLDFYDAFDYSEFWIHDTTTTPHLFYNNEQDAYIIFRFFGTRFWLTGVRGNDVGSFLLTLDDEDPVLVWEIQDAEIAQNNKLVLLYQSNELEYKEHEVKISRTDYRLSFANLMYTTYPYTLFPPKTQTPEQSFDQSFDESSDQSFDESSDQTIDESSNMISISSDTYSDTNIIITPGPIESTPSDSTDIIAIDVNRTESDINKRFENEITNSTNYVVKIKDTNFSSINHNQNGGAVCIVNSGLQCNKIAFNDCNTNEAGGAIYIKNINDQSNSIEFNDISFSNCTAKFGGALYVLSTSSKVPVKIENCKFEGNLATSIDKSDSFQYGGNSIFLTIKRGLIRFNTFIDKSNNDCNTMCIRNSFDSNNLNLLNDNKEDSNSITISDCTFEMPQVSSCCIFYTGGVKGSSYEIQQCSFIGNLSSGAHFIDGEMISEDCPKLVIKKCKFTCNSNEGFDFDKNFVSVDLNDQTFNDSLPKSSNNKWKTIVAIAVPVVVVVVIIVVVIVVVTKKKRDETSSQEIMMPETENDPDNFDI